MGNLLCSSQRFWLPVLILYLSYVQSACVSDRLGKVCHEKAVSLFKGKAAAICQLLKRNIQTKNTDGHVLREAD